MDVGVFDLLNDGRNVSVWAVDIEARHVIGLEILIEIRVQVALREGTQVMRRLLHLLQDLDELLVQTHILIEGFLLVTPPALHRPPDLVVNRHPQLLLKRLVLLIDPPINRILHRVLLEFALVGLLPLWGKEGLPVLSVVEVEDCRAHACRFLDVAPDVVATNDVEHLLERAVRVQL